MYRRRRPARPSLQSTIRSVPHPRRSSVAAVRPPRVFSSSSLLAYSSVYSSLDFLPNIWRQTWQCLDVISLISHSTPPHPPPPLADINTLWHVKAMRRTRTVRVSIYRTDRRLVNSRTTERNRIKTHPMAGDFLYLFFFSFSYYYYSILRALVSGESFFRSAFLPSVSRRKSARFSSGRTRSHRFARTVPYGLPTMTALGFRFGSGWVVKRFFWYLRLILRISGTVKNLKIMYLIVIIIIFCASIYSTSMIPNVAIVFKLQLTWYVLHKNMTITFNSTYEGVWIIVLTKTYNIKLLKVQYPFFFFNTLREGHGPQDLHKAATVSQVVLIGRVFRGKQRYKMWNQYVRKNFISAIQKQT